MTHPSFSGAPLQEEQHRSVLHSVEFLYWEDCPSHERALELLKEAMCEEDIRAEFYLYRLESDPEAEEVGFPGSPTIRVDGADIDPAPDTPIGLSCRAYRLDAGRISPLPPKEKIVQALRKIGHDPAGARATSEFLPCR